MDGSRRRRKTVISRARGALKVGLLTWLFLTNKARNPKATGSPVEVGSTIVPSVGFISESYMASVVRRKEKSLPPRN